MLTGKCECICAHTCKSHMHMKIHFYIHHIYIKNEDYSKHLGTCPLSTLPYLCSLEGHWQQTNLENAVSVENCMSTSCFNANSCLHIIFSMWCLHMIQRNYRIKIGPMKFSTGYKQFLNIGRGTLLFTFSDKYRSHSSHIINVPLQMLTNSERMHKQVPFPFPGPN